MYNGGGLPEESSSCRNVGIDSGGIGKASGIGDGRGPSCLDFDELVVRSILMGAGRSFNGRFSEGAPEPMAGFVDEALRRNPGVDCVRLSDAEGRVSDIVLSLGPDCSGAGRGSMGGPNSRAELLDLSLSTLLPIACRPSMPFKIGSSPSPSTGDSSGEVFTSEGGGEGRVAALSVDCRCSSIDIPPLVYKFKVLLLITGSLRALCLASCPSS